MQKASSIYKNFRGAFLFFICPLLLFFVSCSSLNEDPAYYEKSIMQGNEIVQALEKYKENNGEYPDKLQILVPELLSSLPTPNYLVWKKMAHMI